MPGSATGCSGAAAVTAIDWLAAGGGAELAADHRPLASQHPGLPGHEGRHAQGLGHHPALRVPGGELRRKTVSKHLIYWIFS